MSDNDMDWAVLARYLAGESDAGERDRVERWLAADPAHQDILATMRAVAGDADWVLPADQEARIMAAVEREMARSPRPAGRPEKRATMVPFPTLVRPAPAARAFRRAAAIVLLVGGAAAGYLMLQSPSAPVATTEPTGPTFATPAGQRATFQLVDGTRVMLGPASTLRLARDFSRQAREVVLDGEAYFEVTHDERRPFVVRAGDLVATDLGTEFTVRAYASEGPAQVVVREGIVAVRAANVNVGARHASPVPVHPGQRARLSETGVPIIEPADTALQFAWVAGRLLFQTTPLRNAAREISRWHDVEVRLASPELGARRLTAAFRDEPIAEVLRVITTALDLKVVRDGRVYTLRAR